MCFAIPYRVVSVLGNFATIEGGKTIRLGTDLSCKPGDYLQIADQTAVDVIPKVKGEEIRRMIRSLQQTV